MKVLILSVGFPKRVSKTGKKLTEEEAIAARVEEGPESGSLKRHKSVKRVYFVVSDKTRKLAEELWRKLLKGVETEIVEIDPNSLDEIIENVKAVVLKEGKNQLLVDVTGGTKLMSIGLYQAATYAKRALLFYETGKRGTSGIVIKNERAVKSDVIKQRDNLFLEELFKKRDYRACLELLEKETGFMSAGDKKKALLIPLVKAFYEWDLFNHKKAYSFLREYKRKASAQIKKISDIPCKEGKLGKKARAGTPCQDQFISFLGKLNEKEKSEYHVLDIYYNALRRKDEGRLDDAVARLYRLTEAIAQMRLEKKYEIKPGDVSLESKYVKKLGEKTIQALKNKKASYDKKITLGLVECYWLLSELKDSLYSKIYSECLDKKKETPVQYRNNSILAHGYEPVSEKKLEEVKKLAEKALDQFKKEYRLGLVDRQIREISSTKKLPPELL